MTFLSYPLTIVYLTSAVLPHLLHAFWLTFAQISRPVPLSIHVTLHIPQFTYEGHLPHLLEELRHVKNAFCG